MNWKDRAKQRELVENPPQAKAGQAAAEKAKATKDESVKAEKPAEGK